MDELTTIVSEMKIKDNKDKNKIAKNINRQVYYGTCLFNTSVYRYRINL